MNSDTKIGYFRARNPKIKCHAEFEPSVNNARC